jgi:hypothetical protein
MRHLLTVGLSGSMVGSLLMVSSVFGASAATLNTADFPRTSFSLVSDTPSLLDLKFTGIPYGSSSSYGSGFVTDDRFPLQSPVDPGFSLAPIVYINGRASAPVLKDPVVPILTSDNWTVSAQTLFFTGGRTVALSSIIFQKTIPGGSNVPQGTLVIPRPPFSDSSSRKVSFLADASPPDTQTCVSGFPCSPATTFGTETCAAGTPNCVSFELITTAQSGRGTGADDYFELLGFFTPPNSPKPVPEPSMGIGALTAFGMMLLMRSRKFLSNKIYGA